LNNSRTRAGVSLTEIVVVMGLLTVLLGAIFLFLSTGQKMPEQLVAHLDAQAELRQALARISQEVRECRAVLFPVPARNPERTGADLATLRGGLYRLVPAPVLPRRRLTSWCGNGGAPAGGHRRTDQPPGGHGLRSARRR